ncbi:MAG: cytochrome P460 family protein [Myxococcota bacterium]|nr:cytochrome P460 family protein [Myxococcota bacterium]
MPVRNFAVALFAVLLACAGHPSSPGDASPDSEPAAFSLSGKDLRRPEGLEQWVHVGTAVTPNDQNGGQAPFPGFHSVYLDPASYRHWQASGEFRDGTAIGMQLTSVGKTKTISGKGYFMGEPGALLVGVKSARAFPDEPGNWAYFQFDPGARTAAREPAALCNACHEAAGTHDFVFTEYYPLLRRPSGD